MSDLNEFTVVITRGEQEFLRKLTRIAIGHCTTTGMELHAWAKEYMPEEQIEDFYKSFVDE